MSKKSEILKVSLTHFAKKGYENTSLDDVAKELNITKPALYYHFKNKKTIYNEVFKMEFQKVLPCIQNITTLKDYVFCMAEFFENSEITKLFSKELANEANYLEDDTIELISKTLKKLRTLIPENINPFLIQTIIVSTLITYQNTITLRSRISKIVGVDKHITSIQKDLYQMVQNYIGGDK